MNFILHNIIPLLFGLLAVSLLIYSIIDYIKYRQQILIIHIERCLKILRATKNKDNINSIHDDIDDSIQLLEFILENNKRKDEKNDEKEKLNNWRESNINT